MPIILIAFGVLLILAGAHGKATQFWTDLGSNFTPNSQTGSSYIGWAIAIFIIAATGYWKSFRPITIAFLILVFAVMIISPNSAALSTLQNLVSQEKKIT